jgi:hypothetical protein
MIIINSGDSPRRYIRLTGLWLTLEFVPGNQSIIIASGEGPWSHELDGGGGPAAPTLDFGPESHLGQIFWFCLILYIFALACGPWMDVPSKRTISRV